MTFASDLPMYIPTSLADGMSSVEFFICKPKICYWQKLETFATLFESITRIPRLHLLIPFQDRTRSYDLSQEEPYKVVELKQLLC